MTGRIGSNEEQHVNGDEVAWMSLNNTEQVQSTFTSTSLLQNSPLAISSPVSPKTDPVQLESLQNLSTIMPSNRTSDAARYGSIASRSNSAAVGKSERNMMSQEPSDNIGREKSSIFHEVISDVIDEVSNSLHSDVPTHSNLSGSFSPRGGQTRHPTMENGGGEMLSQHQIEDPQGTQPSEQLDRAQQQTQQLRQSNADPNCVQQYQVQPGQQGSHHGSNAYGHPYGFNGNVSGFPPFPPPHFMAHQHHPPYPPFVYPQHPYQQQMAPGSVQSQAIGQAMGQNLNPNYQHGQQFVSPPGPGYGFGPRGLPYMPPPSMHPPMRPFPPLPGYPSMYGFVPHANYGPTGIVAAPDQQPVQQMTGQDNNGQPILQQQSGNDEQSFNGIDEGCSSSGSNIGPSTANVHGTEVDPQRSNSSVKPQLDSFTTQDFVHLTSSSPERSVQSPKSQSLDIQVSVTKEDSSNQLEAVKNHCETFPSSVIDTQSQTIPADNMKSKQLLSFLKSKSNNNLPSVMNVKYNNDAPADEKSNKITAATTHETIELLDEGHKEQKKEYYRTTKNQMGTVNILKPPAGPLTVHGCRHATQPGGHLSLTWELPPAVVTSAPRAQYVIALTRLGSMNNVNNIVAKTLKITKPNSDFGYQCARGNISFHAPKAAGYYVFRIYDQSDDKTKSETLATSPVFAVELKGRDVTTNLAFIFNSFSAALLNSKIDNGAINGLKSVFELMRTTGTTIINEKPPQEIMQHCVQLLLNMISTQTRLHNAQAEVLANHEKGDQSTALSEAWQKIRSVQKTHMISYDCLVALRGNKIAMGMLNNELRSIVHSTVGLYSPLLSRFFGNFSDLQSACIKEIGFEPAPPDPPFRALCFSRDKQLSQKSREILNELTKAVKATAETLIPPQSFFSERQEIRLRLQSIIRSSGVVPPSCSLVLFGSSVNNFGAIGADLDMCLQYRPEDTLPVGEERGHIIERLGEVLSREGMVDVQARSTARIPILLFKDGVTGIDCDISFNNPLAIRNTDLLATYSRIDDRVRILAFAIKYWAKRREINSPLNGTLSSYGYLLCLIHFLQCRELVPDLQSLPPDWDPQRGLVDIPPPRWEEHPVEGMPCNTYFYDALNNKNGFQSLKKFSSRNKQSLGELLMEFFRYFAYDFDYRRDIVSIRRLPGNCVVTKLSKMESSCWGSHERLSVEDPFETWYDVAHVLKGSQMTYIRSEFLRAYTLMYNAATGPTMGISQNGISLFERICTPPIELPKFVLKQQQQAEMRSRSNTVSSES